MCLCLINEEAKKKLTIESLDVRVDGYVWLWKVFSYDEDEYLSGQFKKHVFFDGKNTAKGKFIADLAGGREYRQYTPGFHCFVKESDATYWRSNCNYERTLGRGTVVVPVKVKKAWITDTGEQIGRKTVVCKHIII